MCLWFHVSLRESWICLTSFHKAIYLPKSSAIQICDSGTPTWTLSVCCRSTSMAILSLACDILLPIATAGLVAREFPCRKAQIRVWWRQTLTVGLRFERAPPKIQMPTVCQSWGLVHSQIKASCDWSLYKKGFLHSIPCRGCRTAQTMSQSLKECPTVKKFILPFSNYPASGILS